MFIEVTVDGGLQIDDGAKDPSSQSLAGQSREEILDGVATPRKTARPSLGWPETPGKAPFTESRARNKSGHALTENPKILRCSWPALAPYRVKACYTPQNS